MAAVHPEPLRIGIVGWGRMGRPMGQRLLAAGHQVVAHDISAGARRAVEAEGAQYAATPAEVAAASAVLITMLPHPQAVMAAARGPTGVLAGLEADTLWLEMSSSDPQLTRDLADAASQRSAALLDAPVSGGVGGARDGALTIMAGGDGALVGRARPVLDLLGSRIVHVGTKPGDGDLAKTINNMLSAVNLTAAAEGLALGVRGGLDPGALIESIGSSSGSSHASRVKIPQQVLTGAFDAGFTISQYIKDLRIALGVAARLEVPTPMGSITHALWAGLSAEGRGGDDHTAVVPLLGRSAGVGGEVP